MGDERGIRLRCISLGDAALRGSRMSARARCSKGSASRIARSSLSNARSSVCATSRCLRINITVRQLTDLLYYLLNRVKVTTGPGIPRAAHDSAMVPAAARPLPLVPCKSWSHEHAALWNGS